jgi:hypothetical protein
VGPSQQYKLFSLLPFLHHPHYLSKHTNMEKPMKKKKNDRRAAGAAEDEKGYYE